MEINFHKNELFCFGMVKKKWRIKIHIYSNADMESTPQIPWDSNAQQGKYPFKYLGIPMHYRKLSNSEWRIIVQHTEKKLSSWKEKHLSVVGRLILINPVFTSLVMFMLAFFEAQEVLLRKLIITGRDFSCKLIITKRNIN